MAKIGSGTVVTGLTLGAMAAVAALAVQANGSERKAAPASPPPPTARTSAAPRGTAQQAAPEPPAGSGAGRRVVYSLAADRVWLVDPAQQKPVVRTYKVQPSTVDPAPGGYRVFGRTGAVTGSDGRPIEHVVLFARASGTVVGFSAAVDGTTPKPDPGRRTGGIRETRPDGAALWAFAPLGGRVVVVP